MKLTGDSFKQLRDALNAAFDEKRLRAMLRIELETPGDIEKKWTGIGYTVDPSEIDTIVVPAREEGFEETFIDEQCWYKIRIHSSMIPKIKWVAAYRVAPISAITHIAPVKSIEQFEDTNKYILYFSEPARKIGPIKLISNGDVEAPQAPRYTSMDRLQNAQTMDEAF